MAHAPSEARLLRYFEKEWMPPSLLLIREALDAAAFESAFEAS